MKLNVFAAALTFLLMVAYWPGVLGAAVSLRWAVLWLALPFMLAPLPFTIVHWLGVIFLAYGALSLCWTPFPLDGLLAMSQLASIVAGFSIGLRLASLQTIFIAAACGLSVSSAIAIGQSSGFNPTWVQQLTLRPSGLFANSNVMAEAAAMVLAGLLASVPPGSIVSRICRLWLPVALVLPALVLPLHRGSMIALVIAGMSWTPKTFRNPLSKSPELSMPPISDQAFRLPRYSVNLSIALGAVIAFFLLAARTDIGSIKERVEIWQAAFSGITWFGHGIGSFRGLFPLYAANIDTTELWPQHAHNDCLELLFEGGVMAFLPLAMVLCALQSLSPARYVLIVFLIEGLVEFPLHMPVTAFLAAVCLGHLTRDLLPLDRRELARGILALARRGREKLAAVAARGVRVSVRCALSHRAGLMGAQCRGRQSAVNP